jgi:phosphatidate cytidylyltransferase
MAKLGGGTATRTATALFLIALTLGLIWIPVLEIGFLVYICVIAGFGLQEFYTFTKAKNTAYRSYLAVPLGILIIMSAYFEQVSYLNATLLLAGLVVAFTHIIKPNATMKTMFPSLFGLAYVGWNSAHLVLLHRIEGTGPALATLLIASVAMSDTGAYFVGKSIGKHKLAAVVSPNKTWEGAVGGFLFSVLTMVGIYLAKNHFDWANVPDWTLGRYVLIGAVLSVASQIGDLTESAFKRDAGVKDSGTLFPGHGGALDRCDGLLVAAPVLYYLTIL